MKEMFLELKISKKVADKIWKKHQVSTAEAKEVIFNQDYHIRKAGKSLYLVFGTTYAGRYLFMVVKKLSNRIGRLITARDMEKNEKRLYQKVRGN